MTRSNDEWAWLDELLYGITLDEGDDPRGWWPTSTGAEFGARKLAEIKAAIRDNLHAPVKESWMAGWLAADAMWYRDHGCCRQGDTAEAEYAWNHREDTRHA